MEGSRSETSAAEESEEIIYTSVKFSQTSLTRAKAAKEKRGCYNNRGSRCGIRDFYALNCTYLWLLLLPAHLLHYGNTASTEIPKILSAPCLWPAVVPGLAIAFGILSISLAIALIWKMSHSHPRCPEQWVAYRGSCYSFSRERKDWHSSRESCRAQGAHLLVVNDALEMDLFKSIQTRCFWVGLRNSTGSGWIWEDGSVLNGTKVLSNSPVQHCAVLMNNHFQASSCEFSTSWICEKSLR